MQLTLLSGTITIQKYGNLRGQRQSHQHKAKSEKKTKGRKMCNKCKSTGHFAVACKTRKSHGSE